MWVAEAERGGDGGAEPSQGWQDPVRGTVVMNQDPESAQPGLQLPGQDRQKEISLLPRSILCSHVLFSWQALPRAPKVAEALTRFPFSPKALQEAPKPCHKRSFSRKPFLKTSFPDSHLFLMHGGKHLLLFPPAFPSKTFPRQGTSQVCFYN